MMEYVKDKRGLTLVELIIVFALLTVIIGLAFSFYWFGSRTFASGGRRSDLQAQLRMASRGITREVRNSITVEIMSSLPASFDNNKKYIYLQGNAIKMNRGLVTTTIIPEISGGLNLAFTKGAGGKLLAFSMQGDSGPETYTLNSEVMIANMGTGTIGGAASGPVVIFGPFTPSEAAAADASVLNLLPLNGLTDYNITDSLLLPVTGINGSSITWTSSNTAVIASDGTVNRPGTSEPDAVVTLTAAIANAGSTQTRDYVFTVLHRQELALNGGELPQGTPGTPYNHQITASGGYGGYQYAITGGSLPDGILLAENSGDLSGTPTAAGTYTFTITVKDVDDPAYVESNPALASKAADFTLVMN